MTRAWSDSTFVFISTRPREVPGGTEERLVDVMAALAEKGATVRFLCLMHSTLADRARARGIAVDPYILDKWNVIRARSRLRKYLRRYHPVVAHSVGLEADLLLRWAARRVQGVHVATTLPIADTQGTRRRRPVDAIMRRLDEVGLASAQAIFVETEAQVPVLRRAHVPDERIVVDRPPADELERRASIARHLQVYQRLMAQRGSRRTDPHHGRGGTPPRHGGGRR